MASPLRLGSLRSSLAAKPVLQSAAYNGVRCYSSVKAKVGFSRPRLLLICRSLTAFPQSLKETFADKLPGEIEKVKKLKKYCLPVINWIS